MSSFRAIITGVILLLFSLFFSLVLQLPSYIVFPLAFLALGGLSTIIGFSLDHIALHYSLPLTTSLQALLGSLPLALVVIFLLKEGEGQVAQMTIVGSIIVHTLFVIGLVFSFGALKTGKITFEKRVANETSILFIMAVMAFAFLGAAVSNDLYSEELVYKVSAIVSILLLLLYSFWTYWHIKSRPVIHEDRDIQKGKLPFFLLAITVASLFAAAVAWVLVERSTFILDSGISPAFLALVLLPLATSFAGSISSLFLLRRGHPKTATAMIQNTTAQITAFLFPVLVLLSFFLPTRLTLGLTPILLTILAISGIVYRQISNDGEATLFEGVALIVSFLILSVLTFYGNF